MNEQQIFDAVQNIFRDNFDDDSLVLTRETTADDIEDWDSLEQINLLTAMEKQFGVKFMTLITIFELCKILRIRKISGKYPII